jgi:hypothetical protein
VILFAIALVFYAAVPLLGAWRARREWTRFREAVFRAVRSPEADLSLLQSGSSLDFRLTGRLEAFEGRDRLWIGGEHVSASVSLRGAPVYFLDEEPPRRVDASSLGALPEGTPFLVAGPLSGKPGQAHFAAAPGRSLLVLAFEGDPATALERAVSSGRPRVDIWNQWTPIALGIGFALLLSLAYAALKPAGSRSEGTTALALALLPSTLFLPPGLFGVLGFVRLWARARARRAASDAGRLSGVFEAPRGAAWRETAAYGLLLAGMTANAALLLAALGFWIP